MALEPVLLFDGVVAVAAGKAPAAALSAAGCKAALGAAGGAGDVTGTGADG